MWSVQTKVCIETEDGGVIFRPFSLAYKAGRIPSRERIKADAYAAAEQWKNWLQDTVGSSRSITYGAECGLTITSIDFIK